jgi:flagellar hook-basal body complex protein FliE
VIGLSIEPRVAALATPVPVGATAAASEAGFGAAVSSLAAAAIEQVRAGETAAIGGLRGSVPLQDAVAQVMAAEQALQAGLALREKIVNAYLEISRMTI